MPINCKPMGTILKPIFVDSDSSASFTLELHCTLKRRPNSTAAAAPCHQGERNMMYGGLDLWPPLSSHYSDFIITSKHIYRVPKRLLLCCMNSPLRQNAGSRNLSETFLSIPVQTDRQTERNGVDQLRMNASNIQNMYFGNICRV